MKIYVLVRAHYDYYELTKNVDVDTDLRELLKRCPGDLPLFTTVEHENENDVEHYFIETWVKR